MNEQTQTISSKANNIPYPEITEAITKVSYGSVSLIIQDGKIVQIEILEKKRL